MLKDRKRLGFPLSCFLLLASLGLGAGGLAYPPSWSDDIRITEDSQNQEWPDVAVSSQNHIWCVWRDERDSNYEIYFTKLDSVGGTLIDDTNLSDNPTNSRYPVVAVDSSDDVHIVWRDVDATGFDVWYAKLDSAANVLAVHSSDRLHLVWQDYRNNNWDIYHKRGENEVGVEEMPKFQLPNPNCSRTTPTPSPAPPPITSQPDGEMGRPGEGGTYQRVNLSSYPSTMLPGGR